MQQGPYILDRWMVRMLRNICSERTITFRTFSDDWVLEMEKNGKTRRVVGYQFDLNDAAASGIAQDKVAAYQILSSRNIPAVPHVLLRTKAGEAQWQTMDWDQGVVVKPLLGTGGHGIKLFNEAVKAKGYIHASGIEAWAASPLQEAVREARIVLLDGEVLLAYQKQSVDHDGLKLFNLGQGAVPALYEPTNEVLKLAKDAQEAIGLRICAVDIFELESGGWRVLEVNSGFMMEHYARFSKENERQAEQLYRQVVETLFT